jgi:hypothetical protein
MQRLTSTPFFYFNEANVEYWFYFSHSFFQIDILSSLGSLSLSEVNAEDPN